MVSIYFESAAGECKPSAVQRELPTISILIKALNEEAKIGRCIESVIMALTQLPNPSEVILADSLSDDRTVELALRFPIKTFQFRDVVDRGVGAAVQLAYQHSRGDFVMLLDGDMELRPGFLEKGLMKLLAEPELAGVAGLLEDTSVVNEFDRRRVERSGINRPQRSARWLNGGGLYRRAAIAQAGGYAADRNLKAWEEADLGMRLTAAGWSMERIDCPSTLHTGHSAGTWTLLRSAWRSRRAMANGVLLKQSFGKPWMVQALAFMRLPLLVVLTWIIGFVMLGVGLYSQHWAWAGGYAFFMIVAFLALVLHKRGILGALTSLGMWHYMAAALLAGLRDPLTDPLKRIDSVELTAPGKAPASTEPNRIPMRDPQLTSEDVGMKCNAS